MRLPGAEMMPVMVGIDGPFRAYASKQPALEIFHARLQTDRPCNNIQVEISLASPLGMPTLAEFRCASTSAVELVRIGPGKVGVVSPDTWVVVDSTQVRARNDRLQLAYFANRGKWSGACRS